MSLRDHPFRIYYGPADDPLANFYIPALSASVRYDRSAGFFSSSALAVAAAGVARLIQNGGRMRLLVGGPSMKETSRPSARATICRNVSRHGCWSASPTPRTHSCASDLRCWPGWWPRAHWKSGSYCRVTPTACRSLRASHRTTIIPSPASSPTPTAIVWRSRVVSTNQQLPGARTTRAFVLFSWEATEAHLEQITVNFERLWQGQEPDWIALDIPAAVRDRLLVYRPQRAPTRSFGASDSATGRKGDPAHATSAAIHRPNASCSSSCATLPTCRVRSGWERPRPPSRPGHIRRVSPMSSWPISPAGPCCAMRSAWARPSKPAW